ncbi:ABC transporter substrate-binding protein [Myceligenerans pegani]|uniref:ABC transporter substrate-binding protein n=1 Tax=Myceligenerans pegani TaxID=2776917 RepID=A0ABR9MU13_9MICO|nr:ABC transporter substrate-binding protein [Myceligenerans sp. TRM 65318]MBE1874863.1 ABC transporter substrate-binding protein [Myceligenerans sp. TRM 65318]MBE3017134.1 ABC transporter substrate-binding protein [Myceligenerans sp. TRM 65318]
MRSRKAVAVLVAPLLGLLSLAACSGTGTSEDPEAASLDQDWSAADPITIDVFDGLANYQGIQGGWFGKIVKDKFNMELNIIAPNVAGGGDTLYNTRVSGGDLGDLIVTDKGEKLDELVEGGLLHDMSPYYESMEHLPKYDAAIQTLNESKDGVYGFPTQLSSVKPTEPNDDVDPTFGPFLRWDYYAELGYPEIGTLEDLLPVLKDMQDAHPEADNGKPSYAISLFKDWDGNMMVMGKQPTTLYGYDEMGFVLAKADGSDYQSIIDSDSQYVRALRFYYEANQMGLVDPDSTTQNYDTMFTKYQNGQVLLSWWPWLGQSAYNTEQNMAEGKGFMIAPLQDQKVFAYGAEVYGGEQVVAIGSQAEDPARIAAFIDWLYSPEGVQASASETMGAAGPVGLTWENGPDGPELTDFGRKAILEGGADVPADWGGGAYKDGVSTLNFSAVLPIDEDPTTGYPYNYKLWPSYQETTANPLTEDWSEHMGGATTTMEYLRANDMLLVAPGASFITPTDESEIETARNQIKASIVEYSWKMSFAKDDAEFESLLAEMQETVNGLGYEKVLEVDMANARAQNDARVAVANEFG